MRFWLAWIVNTPIWTLLLLYLHLGVVCLCLVMTFFFSYPLLFLPFPLFLYPLNLLLLRTMDINKYATRSPLHYIFPTPPPTPLSPSLPGLYMGVLCLWFFLFAILFFLFLLPLAVDLCCVNRWLFPPLLKNYSFPLLVWIFVVILELKNECK